MNALEEMLAKVKQLKDDLDNNTYLKECLMNDEANERKVVKLNTDEQLFQQGINSAGGTIKPPYAESTIKRKLRNNLPTDHITLYDTGRFYDSIYLDVRDAEFEIKWQPREDYFKHLQPKYGQNVLGLTDYNVDAVRYDIVLPFVQSSARQTLFG